MLNERLAPAITEAVARLTGDYAAVATFDALYRHAASMSDNRNRQDVRG